MGGEPASDSDPAESLVLLLESIYSEPSARSQDIVLASCVSAAREARDLVRAARPSDALGAWRKEAASALEWLRSRESQIRIALIEKRSARRYDFHGVLERLETLRNQAREIA
jgi:hypothetical protein